MSMQGMDVEVMTSLAEQFERAARDLGVVALQADGHVRRGVAAWFGSAAEEFAHIWSARHRSSLLAIEGELVGVAGGLRREIVAQIRASAAVGPAGAGGACRVPPHAAGVLALGQSLVYADGRLRITREKDFATTGPRDVRGLLAGLYNRTGHDGGTRAYDYPGGVSVLVEGTVPNRHVIVYISGTEQWGFDGRNPSDMGGNVGNLLGESTGKEAAIRQALIASGVSRDDQIMLVGHSQGGADALAFAHDSAQDPRFDIRSVVTVGAPPESKYPPSGVDVLQLKGTHDAVPTLPFRDSAGDGVTGVAVHDHWSDDPLNSHDPATYAARLNENDPGVAGFEQRQAGFFGGQGASGSVYSNERTSGNAIVEKLTTPSPDPAQLTAADEWLRRHL